MAALLASLLLASCASEPAATSSAAKLNNLTNVSQLQKAFNQDRDIPRVILLLSPT